MNNIKPNPILTANMEMQTQDSLALSSCGGSFSEKDPRDVSHSGFNRFDPKYVSIGPKAMRNTTMSGFGASGAAMNSGPNKCATLRHAGRYGGNRTSPSPNLKNVAQPTPGKIMQQKQQDQEKEQQQQQQLLQQQLMQLNHQKQIQSKYNISTVSKDYNNPNHSFNTLPYKKPGTGFQETTSILKHDRESREREAMREMREREREREREPRERELREREAREREARDREAREREAREREARDREAREREARDRETRERSYSHPPPPPQPPQPSIFSIETAASHHHHRDQETSPLPQVPMHTKPISILSQPLPEIPTVSMKMPEVNIKNNQQPLSAANLHNYRSLQRPQTQTRLSSLSSGANIDDSRGFVTTKSAMKQSEANNKPVVPPKVKPPSLPPKNRHKDEDVNRNVNRPPQPLPPAPLKSALSAASQQYVNNKHMQQQHQYSYDSYDSSREGGVGGSSHRECEREHRSHRRTGSGHEPHDYNQTPPQSSHHTKTLDRPIKSSLKDNNNPNRASAAGFSSYLEQYNKTASMQQQQQQQQQLQQQQQQQQQAKGYNTQTLPYHHHHHHPPASVPATAHQAQQTHTNNLNNNVHGYHRERSRDRSERKQQRQQMSSEERKEAQQQQYYRSLQRGQSAAQFQEQYSATEL